MTSYADALAEAIEAYLAPALEGAGFSRKSSRSREWTKDNRLQVRIQSDSKANDPYSGGAFKVEFEVSSDGRFSHKLSGRVIAEQLLDQQQRARFLARRNQLAEEWGAPPREHLVLIPEFLHEQYLKHFSAATDLEREFGMRFRTQAEANEWLELLARELPTLISRANTLSPRELYLGKPLDW